MIATNLPFNQKIHSELLNYYFEPMVGYILCRIKRTDIRGEATVKPITPTGFSNISQ
jgi:hypothetical protein